MKFEEAARSVFVSVCRSGEVVDSSEPSEISKLCSKTASWTAAMLNPALKTLPRLSDVEVGDVAVSTD